MLLSQQPFFLELGQFVHGFEAFVQRLFRDRAAAQLLGHQHGEHAHIRIGFHAGTVARAGAGFQSNN